MKKLSISLVMVLVAIAGWAKVVDPNQALKIAKNFLQTNVAKLSSAELELVQTCGSADINQIPYYYVFNVSNGDGFVMISADDRVLPILGYSAETDFNTNKTAEGAKKWFEGYKNQIRYTISSVTEASPVVKAAWKKLQDADAPQKGGASVNPLLTTRWNQSPYYNDDCPGGSVTGCVATAMAQVMKYWNYPESGQGYHSYNEDNYGTLSANFGGTTYQWSSMPNTISGPNQAISTLMYHCGVSVDMNYSPESSGAYVIEDYAQDPNINAEHALKTFFGYKSSMKGELRSQYSEAAWIDKLKVELDAARPIIYAGFGSGGGHCFVADGYDNNDYFHMNWGWGGSENGYFEINALNPGTLGTGGGSGGFNSNQQAIFGMEPPATTGTNYDVAIHTDISPSSTQINYLSAFSVSVNFINTGNATFIGDFGMAILDQDMNIIDFVEIKSAYNLPPNNIYQNPLNFSNSGMVTLLPGDYYFSAYCRPSGGEWIKAANSVGHTNLQPFSIVNPNDIELYNDFVVQPSDLIQGESATISVNVYNTGSSTFYGDFDINLYDLEGNYVQTIGSYTETQGLPSGYVYQAPGLEFFPTITAQPGTYLLALLHTPDGGSPEITGSTNYQNPTKVIVKAPAIDPDQYEVNDTKNQAYALNLTYTNNKATKTTTGSNLHTNTDIDFFKVNLSSGFNYTIKARIHDSYSSGNGNVYSLDGLISYSTDGTNWSDTYDDTLSPDIVMNGGGTLYFKIAPYFAGGTGTYLLDFTVNRSSSSSTSADKNSYCQGEAISVTYSVGSLNSGNSLSVYLSDANGSFGSETLLKTVSTTTSTGTITTAIPVAQAAGTNYRFRLKSTSPATTYSDNGSNLTVNTLPTVTLATLNSVCSNAGQVTLSGGAPTGGTYSGTGVSGGKFNPSSGTQEITYTYTNGSGCTSTAKRTLTVKAAPAKPTISVVGVTLTSSSSANNQWYMDGSIINGATNQQYTAVQNGVYTVKVTNSNQCSETSIGSDVNNVGINEFVSGAGISIYPNPANAVLTIETNREFNYVMTDISGRVVGSGSLKNGNNQLQVQDLATGTYLIQLTNEANASQTLRFVKK